MNYDFDKIIDRRNTGSLKWKCKDSELPMWVADMDFPAAPFIVEAIEKRLSHPVFGYTSVSPEWKEAVISWWERRHNFTIEQQWLLFCTGVIPAIGSAIREFTLPGDNVLVLSPVYSHFFVSIEDNGRAALESCMIYSDGRYSIDFDDFEAKLAMEKTKLFVLSNPANPTGNIWDKETLKRIGDLCYKHGVVVLSDEIHCDITDPGYEYIPFASVSETCRENSITCIAPTKAFNLAGIQTAAVSVPNDQLRRKLRKGIQTADASMPNVFAQEAAVAAFTKGDLWIDEMRSYIYENKKYVTEYIEKNISDIKVISSHGTYLMWLDLSQVTEDSEEALKELRNETGLFLNDGTQYRGNGKSFARINVACPKKYVEDAMERLREWRQI